MAADQFHVKAMLHKLRQYAAHDPSILQICTWIEEQVCFNQEQRNILLAKERQIKRQQHDFATVLEIANQINAQSLNLERCEGYITSMVMGQFGVLKAFILKQEQLQADCLTGGSGRLSLPKDRQINLCIRLDSPFCRWLRFHRNAMLLSELHEQEAAFPEIQQLRQAGVALIHPLVKPDNGAEPCLKGILCLGEKISQRPYSASETDFLSFLADMIAISLDNAHLYQSSITDSLTQVYTRGYFDFSLYRELTHSHHALAAGTATRPVSLVILDIDHFKSFNDNYGHQVGDTVLRDLATLLARNVRKVDIVARYGGEEFVIIFPEACKNNAIKLAERLKDQIEQHQIHTGQHGALSVTVSMGVATFPEDAQTVQELILAADQALYRAKEAGRNQVVVAGRE